MSKGEKREEGLMSPAMMTPMKKPAKGMDMAKKQSKGKGKGGGKKGC